jgi:hypothetical protein
VYCAPLSDLTDEQATQEISIDLHEDGDHLRLIVESGGTGWPLPLGSSAGLDPHSLIFSKAHLLGGAISIERGTHHGRRIVFRMPLPELNAHPGEQTECKTHPTAHP